MPDVLVTRTSLAAQLRAAGVGPGRIVLVHASLRSMGFVCGGAVTVVQALLDVVAPDGTIAMPAHSSSLSDPSHWVNPLVPPEWWPAIRAEMPAFDARLTPTTAMGAIAETFRRFPGTRRSRHPSGSFAARGPAASRIVRGHSLSHSFGERSPLARLCDLDALVLLLGAGHGSNTSLHLAEERWGGLPTIRQGAPVTQRGLRVWRTFDEPAYDADDFPAIGEAFEAAGHVRRFRAGATEALVMSQRALVDFGVSWMRRHRSVGRPRQPGATSPDSR